MDKNPSAYFAVADSIFNSKRKTDCRLELTVANSRLVVNAVSDDHGQRRARPE